MIIGYAFIQNLRRGLYELGVEARTCRLRVAASFDELAAVIWFEGTNAADLVASPDRSTQSVMRSAWIYYLLRPFEAALA